MEKIKSTKRVLEITFLDEDLKDLAIEFDDVKEGLDKATIEKVGNFMIQKKAFEGKESGELRSIKGIELITTTRASVE